MKDFCGPFQPCHSIALLDSHQITAGADRFGLKPFGEKRYTSFNIPFQLYLIRAFFFLLLMELGNA